MMKSDGRLDQGLQELSIGFWCIPPHVFQNFVTLKELRPVE
jgi:hypothetical protein